AYELCYGPIPEGRVVLHHCDNPPCVKPSHLCLGTQRENIADMVTKGRNARGEQRAIKLSEKYVRKILALWHTGDYRQKDLARLFNVSRSMVAAITRGERWGHIAI